MDLRHLVGGHLTGMVAAMTTAYGDMVSSTMEIRADGVEDRLMSFERHGTTTQVRAMLVDGDPDADPVELSRWHLAIRTVASDDVRSLHGA